MRLTQRSVFLLLTMGLFAHPALGASAARGKMLAAQGDCAICHTAPGAASPPYAGGYALHAIFGTVYSTNITPDGRTGIGRWTADQFHRALHDGVAADGHHLYPAFPYNYFTRLSRQDSDDLFAYLRTVRPVHNVPPPNRLIFPANIRWGITFWNLLFLDRMPLKPDPSKSAAWNRGNRLVNGIGHCGGCHTPKSLFFSDRNDRALQGETIDGWYAPNLTASPRTGLGGWTVGDITQYLKTGGNRFGRVVGAMQDVVRISTSRLSDADRQAIALYLKSLAPALEPQPRPPAPAQMRAGRAVYVRNCAVCHTADTNRYPGLARNSVVAASDPTTMLHVILDGAQSVPIGRQPTGFSMPSFRTIDNGELATLMTYIRGSWGNDAGAVTVRQVRQIRDMLTAGE